MKQLQYKVLGVLSLGLGFLGAFLPLLPTTCFVLLAAWCFAKSSPRWHQRLLESKLFGGVIRAWEEERCIPPKARKIAITSMLLFGTLSFWFMDNTLLRVLLVTLIFAGIGSIHYFSQQRRTNKFCPHRNGDHIR